MGGARERSNDGSGREPLNGLLSSRGAIQNDHRAQKLGLVSWFNFQEFGHARRDLHLHVDRTGLEPEKRHRRDMCYHGQAPDVLILF